MSDKTVILAGVRTPIGTMSGALASVPAPQLGAACIKALMARTGISAGAIDEVIMGNVIGAGVGQNPAATRRPSSVVCPSRSVPLRLIKSVAPD